MTEIYLMRHGETDWNREERLQGQVDRPLNEPGIAQAEAAGKRFRAAGLCFDQVWTSPLSRAIQTAILASGFDRSDLQIDPDLMEMNFGPYEGVSFSDLTPEIFTFFRDPMHSPVPIGMESPSSLMARTGRFIGRLLPQAKGRVLVVAHGVAIRAILGHLYHNDSAVWSMPIENCVLYRSVLADGTLTPPEKLELREVNV